MATAGHGLSVNVTVTDLKNEKLYILNMVFVIACFLHTTQVQVGVFNKHSLHKI